MRAKTGWGFRGPFILTWVVFVCAGVGFGATYGGGSGTVENPYQIKTAEHMNMIGANPGDWSKSFILMNDIDMGVYTGTSYKIIGTSAPQSFRGSFDGGGHTISNFQYVTTDFKSYIGLFGYVACKSISNLSLTQVQISSKGGYLGALAGMYNSGSIMNCSSAGSVKGDSYVGGLMGFSRAAVSDCSSSATVNGQSRVGGIVGYQYGGSILDCFSAGVVSAGNAAVSIGGLVGEQEPEGTIGRCYSSSTVSGGTDCKGLGGLVGLQKGKIENSYNTGSVSGGDQSQALGGLVGDQFGPITNCYSLGAVVSGSGSKDIGGVVGLGRGLINSFWNVETSGIGYSGGGKGRTSEQMKMAANYFGWNSDGPIWTLDEGNGFPRLAWENIPGTLLTTYSLNDFVPGDGSEANPYQISTAVQLNVIGLYPDCWKKAFRLEADIDLSGLGNTEFNRIGNYSKPFSGTFDGQGHVIRGFTYCTEGSEWYIGLFGDVSSEIRSVHLEDAHVCGRGQFVGALAGGGGSLTDCSNQGLVTALEGSRNIGGLTGAGSVLTRCSSAGSVIAGDQCWYVGGLVGSGSTVNESYSLANVLVGNNCRSVGGLTGYGETVVRSYSLAHVSTGDECFYVGVLTGEGFPFQSFAQGSVFTGTNSQSVGGLAGQGSVYQSYAQSTVTAGANNQFVGGLAGSCDYIYYTFSSSVVSAGSGTSYVGGLVGFLAGAIFYPSFWDTETSGISNSAGGEGRTTAEMIQASTYPGWNDEEQVWTIQDGVDYPRLAWENRPGRLLPNAYNDLIPGWGTPEEPYRISTAEQMNAVGLKSGEWDEVFVLEADVDMAEISGTPYNIIGSGLGPSFDNGIPFTGLFEGNGHTIWNLTILDTPIRDGIGLFGYTLNATIRNLGLRNVTIQGRGMYLGGLIGDCLNGITTNCRVDGRVDGMDSGTIVGGLLGFGSGTISDCYSEATVIGKSRIGGLIGALSGTLTTSYSVGSVMGTGTEPVGGLIGDQNGACAWNCYWDIEASGQPYSSGGTGRTTERMKRLDTYIGWNSESNAWTMDDGADYPRLIWETSAGCPIPTRSLGDFINGTGTLEDPYVIETAEQLNVIGLFPDTWDSVFSLESDIDLSGLDEMDFNTIGTLCKPFGGLFEGNRHTIKNFRLIRKGVESCLGLFRNTRQASSLSEIRNLNLMDYSISSCGGDLGGLIGNNNGISVTNCMCRGSVSNLGIYGVKIGGMIGSGGGTLRNCWVSGTVTSVGDHSADIGGLVGNASGTLWRCFSSVEVKGGTNSQDIGGMVGQMIFGSASECIFMGSVTAGAGSQSIGGFAGNGYQITNCYSMGSVSGTDSVGGLVGSCNGDITNCFSTGKVIGTSTVGGLVGYRNGPKVVNSFWDVDTSGQSTSNGGTGKSTIQMNAEATFTANKWDFFGESTNGMVEVWRMCVDGVDYPRLSWEFSQGGDFACPDGVALEDLLYLANLWMANTPAGIGSADADGNGKADLADFAVMAENWMN